MVGELKLVYAKDLISNLAALVVAILISSCSASIQSSDSASSAAVASPAAVANSGAVRTLAGSPPSAGYRNGVGTAARFNTPAGVAVDSSGNVYVADAGNNTIRKITSAGEVSTLAGTDAGFNNPTGLAEDSSGNVLYVADTGNHTIRKIIISTGLVSTLAGTAGESGSADGTGPAARFNSPAGVAVDSSGNVLYVADTENHTIRKIIISTGAVSTLAGTAGDGDYGVGTGADARFNSPTGVAVDSSDSVLYVADGGNHLIRKITILTGAVETLAGTAGNAGSLNGAGTAASFYFPTGVAVDSLDNVYVADALNHTIRKITSEGSEGDVTTVSTLAGTARNAGSLNGTGTAARFNLPTGVAVDSSGKVYVADQSNNIIRKIIISTGDVSTLAGVAGNAVLVDGTGADVRFNNPTGVAVDSSGNVYVADYGNHAIRKISSAGAVTTLAGNGSFGSADGIGSAARFTIPM